MMTKQYHKRFDEIVYTAFICTALDSNDSTSASACSAVGVSGTVVFTFFIFFFFFDSAAILVEATSACCCCALTAAAPSSPESIALSASAATAFFFLFLFPLRAGGAVSSTYEKKIATQGGMVTIRWGVKSLQPLGSAHQLYRQSTEAA